ncbi:MAG TPA: hypothetical protein VFE36_07060 [Candidatus Baltobacteraceae bacterium]|jgi:hypothetical protein|nr:hypothetical protein [Candidatus Baltobacteraceae bacterium]
MALAYLVVLIVFAAFTGRAMRTPFGDGDLFWQKHLGAYVVTHHALPNALDGTTFTAPGAPWTPQEWLFGILAHLAISHDAIWILALIASAVLSAALLISARRAARWGVSSTAIAIVVTLLAVDLGGAYGIRAQVFAWPFFALLLLALDLSGPAVFLALLVVAAWANFHASVMIAIPIVWIDAAVAWFLGGDEKERVRRSILALAVPFATLATPLGVRLPLYALTLVRSPIRQSIDEWQHLTFSGHHAFFWVGGVPLVLLAASCARTLFKERPRDLICTALLFAMTVAAIRNAALVGIVAAPIAARAIDLIFAPFAWWRRDLLHDRGLRILAFSGTVVASVFVFVASLRAPVKASTWLPPVATFERISALGPDRRVFCYDFSTCSIALDYPNLRVFIDGRADPYPLWVWNDFNDIRTAKSDWRWLLDYFAVDTVVVKVDDRLDKALRTRRGWRALPRLDRCCRAYVRPPRRG